MITFDVEVRAGAFRLAARGSFGEGVTGLFGPSGAGKTTLLHALAGLTPVDRGTIELEGRPLLATGRGIDLPPEARRIGVVFQEGRLFPHLDVNDNLRFGRAAAAGVRDAPSFEEVVETLELTPLLARTPAGLSGGERQRVALGRSLLAAPRLLLLDEPLAALDRGRRGQVLAFLRRLQERFGIPTLHVTHDLPELLTLTDRLILLDRGTVRGAGEYRELAVRPEWLGPDSGLGRVNVSPAEVLSIEGETCRLRVGPEGSALELLGVGTDLRVGDRGSVTVGAEEVAIAVAAVGPTSIQNQLPARVARRIDHDAATVLELALGGGDTTVRWLIDITTSSAERLELAEGTSVTALLKASAVRFRGER